MTREEAIYRLKNMAWLYGSAEREQNIEAIDMAIEALSANYTTEKPNDVVEQKNDVVAEPTDLISRADAIEAVCDKCPISFKDKCEWRDNEHCSMKVALEKLPSADRPTDNTTTVSANDIIDSLNDTIKSAELSIVLCKNCIYFDYCSNYCNYLEAGVEGEDFFCKYGERGEE